MKNKKIALVTYQDRGSYGSVVPDEDEMVLKALKERGHDASLEIWTDASVNWKAFDLLLIKSPWDYFNRIGEWYAWLDKIELLGVKTLNPVSVLRWNSDKKYLMEMASAGIETVNTLMLDSVEKVNTTLFEQLETEKLVIKPKISGGAKQTFILDKAEFESRKEDLMMLVAEEDYLAQPFMPQVASDGEWSLVFFGGKFSHALIKKPKSGDFRVQHYFGGTIEAVKPNF
jgi:glutathione synthase/RimK-type ligase-like ATP-grasp enzyme